MSATPPSPPQATPEAGAPPSPPPLVIQVLAGPTRGQRLKSKGMAVRFGRDPKDHITLDMPFVSRHHAELRHENGRWMLVNHSANGTRLAGKRVTTRPRPLPDSAVIAIGEEDVLRVDVLPATPEAGQAGVADDADTAAPAAGERETTGGRGSILARPKIWAGIGIYLLLLLGLLVYLSTLSSGEGGGVSAAPERTPAQIRGELSRPVQAKAPDPRRVQAALEDARVAFARQGVDPDALYRAYADYRDAARYSPDGYIQDPLQNQHYHQVRDKLIKEVIKRYQRAYNMLKSGQYEDAASAFRRFATFFPAPQSPTFRNAQKHWETAKKNAKKH